MVTPSVTKCMEQVLVPELNMQLVQFRQEEDVMIIPDDRTEWAFAR